MLRKFSTEHNNANFEDELKDSLSRCCKKLLKILISLEGPSRERL